MIEGSVRTAGGVLRLTAQLNRASDGFHILSRTAEGAATDLPFMERGITSTDLGGARPAATAPAGHLPDGKAYDLLQRARALRGTGTVKIYGKMVMYLNQAIQIDPLYAEAHAELASIYISGATNDLIDPAVAVPMAEVAINNALALQPKSPRHTMPGGLAMPCCWDGGNREKTN